MDVWVFEEGLKSPLFVHDADGTLEPEMWVREHGVRNFRTAIYFFADLNQDVV